MGLYLELLLSKGFLRLRFGGLIFGRAYFWRGISSEFYGMLMLCRKVALNPTAAAWAVNGEMT